MKKLILIGGGGHCKSCIDVIEQENKYKIAGILDTSDKIGQKIFDYEIVGTDNDIEKYVKEGSHFLITLGQITSADLRKNLYNRIIDCGGTPATIISPDAYVSKHAEIGQGTIIMHKAVVNAGAKIGNNCIINTSALVEHDCVVENDCHVAVGAVLAGGVTVGKESFIGANSVVVQTVSLPQRSFVKAGSLVK